MKKHLCALFALSALLTACPFARAVAEEVIVGDDDGTGKITRITLVWDANPEDDIAGYNVYYGRDSGDYVRVLSVVEPTATISVRGNRTVYFAATAYNTSGLESDLSSEVHWP
jgi:hypothetical protein